MALLFIDSCGDTYDTAGIGSKWDVASGVSVVTTGRTGNCLQLGQGSAQLRKNLPDCATLIAGFAYYDTEWSDYGVSGGIPLEGGQIFYASNNGWQLLSLVPDVMGRLQARNGNGAVLGTSTKLMQPAVWNYIEVKTTVGASAAVLVRVNGDVFLNLTGVAVVNTGIGSPGGFTAVNQFGTSSWSYGYGDYKSLQFWDDVYACDGTGTDANTFLGDVKASVLLPAGAGHAQAWTPHGAATHFGCVASADGDTSYLSDATPGDTDTSTLTALPAGIAVVRGVQVSLLARKDDAGSRSVAAVLSDGTTDVAGAAVSVGDTYAYHLTAWATNPLTGAPWAVADFAALQAGVKCVS